MSANRSHAGVLPGFGLSLGITLTWLSLIVLLPLAALVLLAAEQPLERTLAILTDARTLAAYRLSLGGALVAALVNTIAGLLVAWVLVRYEFPGRKLVDGLIDLPFALPTAVAGIALSAVYAKNGWVGQWLEPLGVRAVYNTTGVVLAMILVSLPFAVRTVQPLIEELEPELEEAAACLGATRLQTLRRVVLPVLLPGVLTAFALCLAKSAGEYGSIIFVSSNLPGRTEIAPLLIMNRLEEFNYSAAAVVAIGMLLIAFVALLAINLLQAWTRRSQET
jgi:sulfate/thiosulfate transport system permease protein